MMCSTDAFWLQNGHGASRCASSSNGCRMNHAVLGDVPLTHVRALDLACVCVPQLDGAVLLLLAHGVQPCRVAPPFRVRERALFACLVRETLHASIGARTAA